MEPVDRVVGGQDPQQQAELIRVYKYKCNHRDIQMHEDGNMEVTCCPNRTLNEFCRQHTAPRFCKRMMIKSPDNKILEEPIQCQKTCRVGFDYCHYHSNTHKECQQRMIQQRKIEKGTVGRPRGRPAKAKVVPEATAPATAD